MVDMPWREAESYVQVEEGRGRRKGGAGEAADARSDKGTREAGPQPVILSGEKNERGKKTKKRRRRRVVEDERGFWGFLLTVTGGTVAVLLSIIT